MNRLLEVREFDKIIGNEQYRDDEKYKYLPKKEFEVLIKFIHEYEGNHENADALDFMKVTYKRNIGDIVSIKNYVGIIQMQNGYQIQVLPKIAFGHQEDKDNVKTKEIFLKMLRSMKDFPSKVFNDASLKVDRMNLYEIFINMYLQEVRKLVKHGIKSSYVRQEDNLKYYKGKLIINKNIQSNICHRERFYVGFDEFNPNRPENRLIKSTLHKLQKITSSAENSKKIMQLLIAFEFVEYSANYHKDFSKVIVDRNTKDYELLMKWSKVFLTNKGFTTFSGDTMSRSLLFSMETVYESYVGQRMKKAMIPAGWEVNTQDRGHYLFEAPRRFSLRPDLVLKRNGRIVIMDTKWKRLIDNDRVNYGISQADMYQMYAYSKKYSTVTCPSPEVWLLYPINEDMRSHKYIEFNSGDGTIVRIFFVDVDKIEDSLAELREKLEKCGSSENN